MTAVNEKEIADVEMNAIMNAAIETEIANVKTQFYNRMYES